MPSKSAKQARTMAACAHGAKLAVCTKIPQSVAKEFNEADKRLSTGKRGYFRMKKGA
jgi:hypothetical protein